MANRPAAPIPITFCRKGRKEKQNRNGLPGLALLVILRNIWRAMPALQIYRLAFNEGKYTQGNVGRELPDRIQPQTYRYGGQCPTYKNVPINYIRLIAAL
jgi:hypothetical protein